MHRNDTRPLSESRRKTLLAKSEPMGIGNGQSLGEGKFTAVVSTFNVVDSQGDMMLPHAFDDSIANFRAGKTIPILFSHNWTDPNANVGVITDMRQTDTCLEIDGQLDLSSPNGLQCFKLLKDGRVHEFSVGGEAWYDDVQTAPDGDLVWPIHKFDLFEVSLCLKGANPETRLVSTKSEDPPADTGQQDTDSNEGSEPNGPRPFSMQLDRDELRNMIREVMNEERSQDTTDGQAEEPDRQSEGEPADVENLPDLTAWAAEMETQLITEGDSNMSMKQELQDTIARVKAIANKAQGEGREFTTDENEEIISLRAKADDLKARIDKEHEASEALKSMLASSEPSDDVSGKAITYKTIGEAFVHSDAYLAFKNATTPDRTPVRIAKTRVRVKQDPNPLSTALPGAVTPTVLPGYTDITYPKPNIFLDLITRGTTNSAYVQYRQLISVTNNAAAVKEGAAKPLSELGTQMAEAKEWTCADGIKVTNQELHDDGIISSLINSTLTRNLNAYLEKTILNGDSATDVAQKGILNTTGTQQVAFDTDVFATVRHAKTVLSNIGTTIQAIVLNPEDNEAIDLMQDKQGRYFGQGPFSAGPSTLWGIPRIESQALPKGTAVMGEFSTVQLLNYVPLTIEAFNQNEDDARHNLTYVRAEERNMLFIREPKRIAVIKLSGSTSSDSGADHK